MWRQLCSRDNGKLAIQINVKGSDLPELDSDEIFSASLDAMDGVYKEIQKAIKKKDPSTPIASEENKKMIDEIFANTDLIFMEEIPNGYCSDWCCEHLPWFIVTTKVGRIKIGNRKRVIEIDWSETLGTKTSDELFESEDVTKEKKLIHAWGIEKAKQYINLILED